MSIWGFFCKKESDKDVDLTYKIPTEQETLYLEKIARSLTKEEIFITTNSEQSSFLDRKNKLICLGFEVYPKEKVREGIYSGIFENIDYCYDMKRDELEDVPKFLISFFHELSHFIGHSSKDRSKEWALIMKAKGSDAEYRAIPTEKLADNLAYALVANNRKEIFDILEGKETKIKKTKNLRLVKEYRKKYLPQ